MSDKMEIRDDCLYTKDHEWAKTTPEGLRIGITAFAVDQLGDITLVNFDLKVGDPIVAGKAFGTIESVKTLADLYAPVSGKVLQLNGALDATPELVNEDCYGGGWMIVVVPDAGFEAESLLGPAAYKQLLDTAGH